LVNEANLQIGYHGLCEAAIENGKTDENDFSTCAVNRILEKVRNSQKAAHNLKKVPPGLKMNGDATTVAAAEADIWEAVPERVSMKETALLCSKLSMLQLTDTEREFLNQAIYGLPITQIEKWGKLCGKIEAQNGFYDIITQISNKWKGVSKKKYSPKNSSSQSIEKYLVGEKCAEVNRTKDLSKNFCNLYIEKYFGERCISQTQFAILLGMPREYVWRYQRGLAFPSSYIQRKIADLLGLSVDCFLNKPPDHRIWDDIREVVCVCITELCKNITRKGLAQILGISVSSITQYMEGRKFPGRNTMIKLADYLGVSEKHFFKLSVKEAVKITKALYTATDVKQQAKKESFIATDVKQQAKMGSYTAADVKQQAKMGSYTTADVKQQPKKILHSVDAVKQQTRKKYQQELRERFFTPLY
jgi:transcriptional regulator with XRE-family HTH domain